ncbi:MAG: A/G-specific adenine glycosylase, partial [Alphaproteobacteria bacterium]|nr:A/G-specific adenine glycosylase [Alphaproteobacteria bacterium]
SMDPSTIIRPLLDWYAKHKRDLPWRQGVTPYRVWLSEIMLQQTTVPAVIPYFAKFTEKYPRIEDLALAPTEDVMHDWAGLGYYSRARNLHAAAKAVAANGGTFPADLRSLPGVGEYTAGAITAIAYNRKAVVVDGNVDRVVARLYAIETPLPAAKPAIKARAEAIYMDAANTEPAQLPQAFMDLGATVCTPQNPKCGVCPLADVCEARAKGLQNTLPKKLKAKDRPKRIGWVYWIENTKGEQLLHRRPAKGLLGGMAGLPTSAWVDGKDLPAHVFEGANDTGHSVRHVFTHFELTLRVATASVAKAEADYFWGTAKNGGMPSVFKKVSNLM